MSILTQESAAPAPSNCPRRVVTMGEAMLLLFNEHIGPLRLGTQLRTAVGGAELNVALGLARLGHTVQWVGVLGQDTAGDLVLERLVAGDVGVDHVRRAPQRTGLMIRERRSTLGSQVHYWRNDSAGAALQADDVPSSILDADTVLHITGITPALGEGPATAVASAVSAARDAGAMVSFDVNFRSRLWTAARARQVLRPLLQADVVFATAAEARLLTDAPDRTATDGTASDGPTGITAEHSDGDQVSTENSGSEEHSTVLAVQLQRLGARDVVIKQGSRGALLLTSDGQRFSHRAPPVPVLDTVGAGDAFTAGYLAALAHGAPAPERLAQAVRTGSYAVTTAGDSEALPRLEDLEDLDAEDADRR